MKYARHAIIFLLLALSLVLSGCLRENAVYGDGDEVHIAYAEGVSSLSPFGYVASDRKLLANIYEPLVRYDKSYNFQTGLAVTWGRLSDTVWEFRLRDGVRFHDGTVLDTDDVIYSLEYVTQDPDSELGSLLNGIKSITKTSSLRFELETAFPDPLLLNKLTFLYVVPVAYDSFETPVGTGPYWMEGSQANALNLRRFDYYWGPAPFFEKAILHYVPGLEERRNGILNGDFDMLANVPPQSVEELKSSGIQIQDFPALEVSFLMLNQGGPFEDENLRKAVWYSLGTDFAEVLGGGYLQETHQYAASGISGFVPDFEPRVLNSKLARYHRDLLPDELSLSLDVPLGLDAFGEMLAEDLAEIDIEVTVNVLPINKFEEKIFAGEAEFYFFGWKYDFADSADFFESVLHTSEGSLGAFNGASYSNTELDELVESASQTLDPELRRAQLEELATLVQTDMVAIPLFEAKTLYGVYPDFRWDIRLDGQILASEIIVNVLQ
jgi:peptide/nickel transport system substrate-binding protein